MAASRSQLGTLTSAQADRLGRPPVSARADVAAGGPAPTPARAPPAGARRTSPPAPAAPAAPTTPTTRAAAPAPASPTVPHIAAAQDLDEAAAVRPAGTGSAQLVAEAALAVAGALLFWVAAVRLRRSLRR